KMISLLLLAPFALCFENSQPFVRPTQTGNDGCTFRVGINATHDYETVAEALNQACTDSAGYIIQFVDAEHFEHLEINKDSRIQIFGRQTFTTHWKVNSSSEQILSLKQGHMFITSVEFVFSQVGNGTILLPSKALFSVGSDEQFQPSVFLEDCYFHSLS
ncbi:MAG: hypothetical protein EZS28_055663, partial [Streblomastix strix]